VGAEAIVAPLAAAVPANNANADKHPTAKWFPDTPSLSASPFPK
jgi:hypothetical protein